MQLLSWAQLQVLSPYGEVVVEIGHRVAVGVIVIDTESAANVDDAERDALLFETVLQFVRTVGQCDEILHFKNLTAYVEVKPKEFNIGK